LYPHALHSFPTRRSSDLDLFVITQEDPRLEDPKAILSEIEAGAVSSGKRSGEDYLVIDDRAQAVREAIRRAKPGDTVLLAGKGQDRKSTRLNSSHEWISY